MLDSGRVTSAALFITLGLVGAFVVSIVAGLWDVEPESGFRAFGRSVDTPGSVRVEVLNGAGTAGLARDATHRLRGAGFDVVFFGNADHFRHDRSVVVDRVGDPEGAGAVAAALGIDSVATAVDSALMLEVTVILGGDWPPAVPPDDGLLDRLRELLVPESTVPDSAGTGDGS